MKDKATKLGRPRLPYNTDGRLYMRIPANMVAPCRELAGMLCEAALPEEVLVEVVQRVKNFIRTRKANFDYDFKVVEPYVIGGYTPRDRFWFTVYSDQAPAQGEKLLLSGKVYEVESVVDNTTDEEREEGLSYSKVCMSLNTSS
jgi:hypothetical protein